MTANSDNKCQYFTCVGINEGDLPWNEDWEDHEIKGLMPASDEWLKVVGLTGEDQDGTE